MCADDDQLLMRVGEQQLPKVLNHWQKGKANNNKYMRSDTWHKFIN